MEPDETHVDRLETLFKTLDDDELNEIHKNVKKYVDENKPHLDNETKLKLNRIIGGYNYGNLALAIAWLFVVAWYVANYYRDKKNKEQIARGEDFLKKMKKMREMWGSIDDEEKLLEIRENLNISSKSLTGYQRKRLAQENTSVDIVVMDRNSQLFGEYISRFINRESDKVSGPFYKSEKPFLNIWILDMYGHFLDPNKTSFNDAVSGLTDDVDLTIIAPLSLFISHPSKPKSFDEDLEKLKQKYPNMKFLDFSFIKKKEEIDNELKKNKEFMNFINEPEKIYAGY